MFNATSPSPLWYDLLQELKTYIREFVGHDDKLWMQCWLNYPAPDRKFDWHGHDWPLSRIYKCRPKKTDTVFETYKIKNELGNIYIGSGHRMHKVEVIHP